MQLVFRFEIELFISARHGANEVWGVMEDFAGLGFFQERNRELRGAFGSGITKSIMPNALEILSMGKIVCAQELGRFMLAL